MAKYQRSPQHAPASAQAGAADIPGLGQLRVLEVLSRHGQMTSASAEMHITHSAVSQAISRLEARFGARLFTKSAGRFVPTPGCLELVGAYLSATRLLRRAVRAAFDPEPGLTVSMPRCVATTWLAAGIDRLRRAVPGAMLQVHADDAPPDFSESDAVLVLVDAIPAGCRGELLFEERIMPVCAPSLTWGRDYSTLEALRGLPLLVQSRRVWRDWFIAQNAEPPALDDATMVADAALGFHAALEGQGLFLACTVTAAASLNAGRLLAPVPRSVATGRKLWLLWPANAARRPAIHRFADWLQMELNDISVLSERRPAPFSSCEGLPHLTAPLSELEQG